MTLEVEEKSLPPGTSVGKGVMTPSGRVPGDRQRTSVPGRTGAKSRGTSSRGLAPKGTPVRLGRLVPGPFHGFLGIRSLLGRLSGIQTPWRVPGAKTQATQGRRYRKPRPSRIAPRTPAVLAWRPCRNEVEQGEPAAKDIAPRGVLNRSWPPGPEPGHRWARPSGRRHRGCGAPHGIIRPLRGRNPPIPFRPAPSDCREPAGA